MFFPRCSSSHLLPSYLFFDLIHFFLLLSSFPLLLSLSFLVLSFTSRFFTLPLAPVPPGSLTPPPPCHIPSSPSPVQLTHLPHARRSTSYVLTLFFFSLVHTSSSPCLPSLPSSSVSNLLPHSLPLCLVPLSMYPSSALSPFSVAIAFKPMPVAPPPTLPYPRNQ